MLTGIVFSQAKQKKRRPPLVKALNQGRLVMSESVSRWKPNQNRPKRLQPSWPNRQAVCAAGLAAYCQVSAACLR